MGLIGSPAGGLDNPMPITHDDRRGAVLALASLFHAAEKRSHAERHGSHNAQIASCAADALEALGIDVHATKSPGDALEQLESVDVSA